MATFLPDTWDFRIPWAGYLGLYCIIDDEYLIGSSKSGDSIVGLAMKKQKSFLFLYF